MDVQIGSEGAFTGSVERSYDALLSALGSPGLGDRVLDAIRLRTEVDRIYCFQQSQGQPGPSLFCAWASSSYPSELIDRYRMLYHRHDPIQEVMPGIPQSSCASITFRAEEIRHTDYREVCFDRFSLRHRLSVVKRVGDQWLTLNLARRSRPFAADEISELSVLGRLALPLLAHQDRFKAKTHGGNFSVPEMERRLEALDKGLTPRERQVCARTVAGMSAEGTALDLGISMASVLTYRQRAYRRLSVSNAMQLAALVMH